MRSVRREYGFSLIEVLLVVAIILVISALAIPNFLRSRMAANEASAVSSLKAIATSQVSYSSTYPAIGFADVLSKLATPNPGDPPTPSAAGYLDWVLSCPTQPCPRNGYNFSITEATGSPVSTFRAIAVPIQPGLTGQRGFCADPTGTIMYDPAGGTNCKQPLP